MGYKPSTHPKEYERRNKSYAKAQKTTKDYVARGEDTAVTLDSWATTMNDWLKAHGKKAKTARDAAKALKGLGETDKSLFEGYAKTVALIMATEGEIEALGDPGGDKAKEKKRQKLEQKHKGLVQQADAALGAMNINVSAMEATAQLIKDCAEIAAPKL